MIIRTSIIGEENKNDILGRIGKGNKNKKINGFSNHIWNGLTKHLSKNN